MNNEKLLLLSDIHIGLQQDNQIWLDAIIALAAEVHDTAIKHNISTICHLGDLFENKKFISQKTHDVAMQVVTDIWKDFRVILIMGNHDQYYKNSPTPNWLRMFKDSPNVTIADVEPVIEGEYCFMPWNYDLTDVSHDGYLFCHTEINNFRMNTAYECRAANLNTRDFNRFKRVFSGHFHFPQTHGNITYLGSTHQQDFGDVGDRRGYYIFDNGELEFIEFTKAPKFVIIRTSEKFTPEQIKGNIVRLQFDKNYGTRKNNEIVERLELMEPAAIANIDTTNFASEVVVNENTSNDIVIKDNDTLLKDYINNSVLPEHLKKPTMFKMLEMLMREVNSEN